MLYLLEAVAGDAVADAVLAVYMSRYLALPAGKQAGHNALVRRFAAGRDLASLAHFVNGFVGAANAAPPA